MDETKEKKTRGPRKTFEDLVREKREPLKRKLENAQHRRFNAQGEVDALDKHCQELEAELARMDAMLGTKP